LIVQSLGARLLKNVTPADGTRFALVKHGSAFEIIAWDHVVHDKMQKMLKRAAPHIEWLRSGYIDDDRNLDFSSSTFETVDYYGAPRDVELRKNIKEHFANAIRSGLDFNGTFAEWFRQNRKTIEFDTGNLGVFRYPSF
jgi:hypothetical protein